jgi:dihydrofolate reductase
MPYWSEEIGKYKFDKLFSSDGLLLGRVTYQGFANAWPSRTDEMGFADRMNTLPKYVVSTTLKDAEWNNSRVIKEDAEKEIFKLKDQAGRDILIAGSRTPVQSLMRGNIIDEYRLLVYPSCTGEWKTFIQ